MRDQQRFCQKQGNVVCQKISHTVNLVVLHIEIFERSNAMNSFE